MSTQRFEPGSFITERERSTNWTINTPVLIAYQILSIDNSNFYLTLDKNYT
jgi:hypothetical protein